MENALIIARSNVAETIKLIANSNSSMFGCDIKKIAADKIAYHSTRKSIAHQAAVTAWSEVA